MTVKIELDEKIAKEFLDYLQNRRKKCEWILQKKNTYPKEAQLRAQYVVELLTPVIQSIKNAIDYVEAHHKETHKWDGIIVKIVDTVSNLESKVKELEIRVNKLEECHQGLMKS